MPLKKTALDPTQREWKKPMSLGLYGVSGIPWPTVSDAVSPLLRRQVAQVLYSTPPTPSASLVPEQRLAVPRKHSGRQQHGSCNTDQMYSPWPGSLVEREGGSEGGREFGLSVWESEFPDSRLSREDVLLT